MTHDDWLAAKQRRDAAAYLIARAYMAGNLDKAGPGEAAKFTAAEDEMRRIEQELDRA